MGKSVMKVWTGTDLGGTNLVSGLISEEGQVLRTLKRETEVTKGPDHVLDKIGSMWRQLVAEEQIDWSQVAGAGIGVPGIINGEEGICVEASNLKWRNLPVASRLSQE